jgi:hypothetical protein
MTPRERLRFLADALCRPFPPEVTFNLGLWHEKSQCGSICCAVGYAATLPELRADGLTIIPTPGTDVPYFEGKQHWDAVAAFFDLSEEQTYNLFLSTRYDAGENTRPGEVSNRIYALLLNAQRGETGS